MKLCECGCGQPTKIAANTDTKRGIRKGDALRFITGHNSKLQVRGDEKTWLKKRAR